MSSEITSFVGLFEHGASDGIERVEIPLIQREYAHGRPDGMAAGVRERFLAVLRKATAGEEAVGLDFVYGNVDEDGTFRPLDGQQRLTTLFLLHWYIASRTNNLTNEQAWTEFAYATRPGARRFCEALVENPLPEGQRPSEWIADEPWHLYIWRDDPTVGAMLVMLDAIHEKFGNDDLGAAWERLTDPNDPAITFHRLAIDDMGSPEDLYIKMNSRGKPLTEFEDFKAQLEKALEGSPQLDDLTVAIDGKWADVMWHLRGEDDVFDDEMLNYLRFIVGLCGWRQGEIPWPNGADDVVRAGAVFSPTNPNSHEHLDFLFDAFRVWLDEDTGEPVDTNHVFESYLATPGTLDALEDERVTVFGDAANNLNLLDACCRTRNFGIGRTLLLYAVLLHRMHETADFPRRLRVLRNLIEASNNEFRQQAMPKLVADVWRLVVDGDLEGVEAFNTAQTKDELLKRDLLIQEPALEMPLFELEDHSLLRGCLMAFELDPATLPEHAETFSHLMEDPSLLHQITGALLTIGDYSRPFSADKRRLGSPQSLGRWRELLALDAPSRSSMQATREVLGRLLTALAASDESIAAALERMQREWLEQCESDEAFDWRYYLVKYPAGRLGKSGMYASPGGTLAFSLCMLEGTGMQGYYRDTVLLAAARIADAQDRLSGSVEYRPGGPWFSGSASTPRWMWLHASGVRIRCVENGFEIRPPIDSGWPTSFDEILVAHEIEDLQGEGVLLPVPQYEVGGKTVDASDRVQLLTALIRDLLAAGL